MIEKLAEKQNWAKATPYLAVISFVLLFIFTKPSELLFWALINIPLYLLHQLEEHLYPAGFKQFMNEVVYKRQPGDESLTDIKIFWINIGLVWIMFLILGSLVLWNIGFGLLIIIFSAANCLTHIGAGIKFKSYNPGLIMAIIQFLISIYAGYFLTVNGNFNVVPWWIGSMIFAIVVHAILFKVIMSKK